MPTSNYEEFLLEDLADPEEAAGYLSACLEEGPDVFFAGVTGRGESTRWHDQAGTRDATCP